MQAAAARVGVLVLSLAAGLADSPRPGFAIDTAVLQLGNVEGAGWSAQEVSLQLDWRQATEAGAVMQVAHLQLPAPLGEFSEVSLECPKLHYDGVQADCPAGRLEAQSVRFGRQRMTVHFRYRLQDKSLAVQLEGLRYLGGRLDLQANLADSGWTATVNGKRLQWAALIRQAIALGYPVPHLNGDGLIDLQAQLQGRAEALADLRLDLQLQDATFTNDAGSIAAEHASLETSIQARARTQGWQVGLQASTRSGAWYFDPVYLEVKDQPVRLDAILDWQAPNHRLQIRDLDYRQPGVVDLHGSGQLVWQDTIQLDTLQLELREGELPALYDTYLQPWLTQTAAGALQTAGRLHGSLQLATGAPVAAQLTLSDVDVEQRDSLYGLHGVNGQLDWSAQQVRQSQLGWQSGHVYRIALGASQLALETKGNRVSLVRAAQIPVLDGGLEIETFELEQASGRPLHWAIDGILTPVSMPALTRALDWPEFGGKLSGVVPQVSYDEGILTVGGILLVRVFDGEVTLRDLKLEQPLGPAPRLQVNALAKNIDLEQLTRTFSFGRIEGRLDGRIDGLQMESWEPVAFDAEFATPAGDRSRHRISQKAVDTISNIGGGGVGGALSRSFLRFLEDFPYDRLGIRCKLQDGVCAMGGVAPAENGYYIVKGRFIPPRLDVIGYSDRVNWAGLVNQLKQATHGQAPVVK
jgi:hypothetical protein